MNSYNVRLRTLREEKNLTLKEASKLMKISRLALYYYEEGYFRPTKKHLKKIETFYEEDFSFDGAEGYPSPTRVIKKANKKNLLVSRLVFLGLTLLMLASSLVGAHLFNKSVSNSEGYYGDRYNQIRNIVEIRGNLGHDLVTGLDYYQYNKSTSNEQTNVIFYKTNNILYFNEVTYSTSFTDEELGLGRYHFIYSGSLGVNSYRCSFSYGNIINGSYFTCDFDDTNAEITKIDNFKIIVKGHESVSEELALKFINEKLPQVHSLASQNMSEITGEPVDFYNDFLPAREQGRVVNFQLQIVGLSLIIPSVILFFIFLGIFTRLMIVNVRPKLVNTKVSRKEAKTYSPLPKDINMFIGIPDAFVYFFARFLSVGSIIMMIVSFLGRLGILPLPEFFSNSGFLYFLQIALLSGIFLGHFINLEMNKRPEILLRKIVFNVYIFLFIATMETIIIAITNAWGYDFASLIYQYLPSNVFQIIAIQYIIFLFLFFQPPFLYKRKKFIRFLWHGLSLIPLAFLVVTYIVSNSYALVYGVEENVFINFWFPNGFLPLSIVSVAFMYLSFFLGVFLEKKYGEKNFQIYSFGDRYSLIQNLMCVAIVVIVGGIDLLFMRNQYAYYLGLGYNYWIFALIPFILLSKYSPNSRQTLLLDDAFKEVRGMLNE